MGETPVSPTKKHYAFHLIPLLGIDSKSFELNSGEAAQSNTKQTPMTWIEVTPSNRRTKPSILEPTVSGFINGKSLVPTSKMTMLAWNF